MFRIGELSKHAGVSTKTIRYYEDIGVLPAAQRGANGYRVYNESDSERLRFVRRARVLDIALDKIADILAFARRNEPPCPYVMDVLCAQMKDIDEQICALQQRRDELKVLHEAGLRLADDVQMRHCVCHLIQVGLQK